MVGYYTQNTCENNGDPEISFEHGVDTQDKAQGNINPVSIDDDDVLPFGGLGREIGSCVAREIH